MSIPEFLEGLGNRHITLAWDDGDIHRITFKTNQYNITTAAYFETDHKGNPELVHSARSMPLHTTDRDRTLVLKGNRVSAGGNVYKYDFKVYIPLSRTLLETGQGTVEADLRWGSTRRCAAYLEGPSDSAR